MCADEVLQELTLQEKVRLAAGTTFWTFGGVPRLNIPAVAAADGPHGLRKQNKDRGYGGTLDSVKAVCFPTSGACACTFDPELLERLGRAVGSAARAENVNLVLGPGVNIKRSPLCGRNFEYYSEDPFLAGKMAAAWIRGVQSTGVGASCKHLAGNSQETERMISDSRIPEETLWEIYLEPFRIAVTEGRPWTVMGAYNMLNGTYCCENPWLLTEVLRKQWGFAGAVITDWGAVNDPAASIAAGLDIEMPGNTTHDEKDILRAAEDGALPEECLDRAARKVLELTAKAAEGAEKDAELLSMQEQLDLALEAEESAAVLLKNENALPLKAGSRIAVIGQMAERPRFQGGGSSRVNAVQTDIPLDELKKEGFDVVYAPGYLLEEEKQGKGRKRFLKKLKKERGCRVSSGAGEAEKYLADEAYKASEDADAVVVFAGLSYWGEAENFDRTTLSLPEDQDRLIEELCRVHKNVIVCLECGSPAAMPWIGSVQAVLQMHLGGCRMGSACAMLLSGKVNPSGKLAETYPLSLSDTPCSAVYPGRNGIAEYPEGCETGYRHYNKYNKDVLFPFGHGLSYTRFDYKALQLSCENEQITVSARVKNTGDCPGAETAQLYIGGGERAAVLKGFRKVFLQPGESAECCFRLTPRDFARFSGTEHAWIAEPGEYRVCIGSSSRDIRLSGTAVIREKFTEPLKIAPVSVLPAKPREEKVHYMTRNTTFRELRSRLWVRPILAVVSRIARHAGGGFVAPGRTWELMEESPLRVLSMGTDGFITVKGIRGILKVLNLGKKKPKEKK